MIPIYSTLLASCQSVFVQSRTFLLFWAIGGRLGIVGVPTANSDDLELLLDQLARAA